MSLPEELALIQAEFERGSYRQVQERIRVALEQYPLAGSLKLWQAITAEALGDTATALSVARPLLHHPDPETRQQARTLVRIWQAPRLKQADDLVIEIPDLNGLEDSAQRGWGTAARSGVEQASVNPDQKPDPVPDSSISTQSNQRMIWIALAVTLLITLGAALVTEFWRIRSP